jgi:hypothetical protein
VGLSIRPPRGVVCVGGHSFKPISGFTTSDHARGQGAGRFESAATTAVCDHFERPATPPSGVRRGHETTFHPIGGIYPLITIYSTFSQRGHSQFSGEMFQGKIEIYGFPGGSSDLVQQSHERLARSCFLDGVLRRAVQRDRLPDITDAVLISRPVGPRPRFRMRVKPNLNLPVYSLSHPVSRSTAPPGAPGGTGDGWR